MVCISTKNVDSVDSLITKAELSVHLLALMELLAVSYGLHGVSEDGAYLVIMEINLLTCELCGC